jgi:hypothetical protein
LLSSVVLSRADDITNNRIAAVNNERSAQMVDPVVFASSIAEVRRLKNELAGMIQVRIDALGIDSLPVGFDDGWVNRWETNIAADYINALNSASIGGQFPNNPWGTIDLFDATGNSNFTVHVDAASPSPSPYPQLD